MAYTNYGRWQTPVRLAIAPLVRRLWRFDISGIENVPLEGGAICCPNHIAEIDSLFIPAVLPRNMIYVGKSEYLDNWQTRVLFPRLGMIPIDRRGGEHSKAALDAARDVLVSGRLIGMYPEGTRSRSGNLHRGRTGPARLAFETNSPLIPIGLRGTAEIQPVGKKWPKFRRPVTIKFGEPIHPDDYADAPEDTRIRQMTDDLMAVIQKLSGLTYVDTYAGSSEGE